MTIAFSFFLFFLTCYITDGVIIKPLGNDSCLWPGISPIIHKFNQLAWGCTRFSTADWALKALGGIMRFIIACWGLTKTYSHFRGIIGTIPLLHACFLFQLPSYNSTHQHNWLTWNIRFFLSFKCSSIAFSVFDSRTSKHCWADLRHLEFPSCFWKDSQTSLLHAADAFTELWEFSNYRQYIHVICEAIASQAARAVPFYKYPQNRIQWAEISGVSNPQTFRLAI